MKQTENAALATALPSRSSPASEVTLTVAARARDRAVSAAIPSTSASSQHRDQRKVHGHPGQREEHQRLEPVQAGQHDARPSPVQAGNRRRRYQCRHELREQEERRGPDCAAGAAIHEQRERQRADHEGQLVQRIGSQKPPICGNPKDPIHGVYLRDDPITGRSYVSGLVPAHEYPLVRSGQSPFGKAEGLAAVILCGDVDPSAVLEPHEHLCPWRISRLSGLPRSARRRCRSACPLATRLARSARSSSSSYRCANGAWSTRSSWSTTRPTGPLRSPATSAPRSTTRTSLMPELGPVLGKGDAMWRALPVLTGEVICFLDADSERFGPHFACGVLGPLAVRTRDLVRQGLLPASVPGRRDNRSRRRRPRHRAHCSPAAQPVLSRSGRGPAAAGGRDRGAARAARAAAVRDRLRGRHRPADRRLLARRARRASPRSTSTSARTPISRCGTSARWRTRSCGPWRCGSSARDGCAARCRRRSPRRAWTTLRAGSGRADRAPAAPEPARRRLITTSRTRSRAALTPAAVALEVPVRPLVAQLLGGVGQRRERSERERSADRDAGDPERRQLGDASARRGPRARSRAGRRIRRPGGCRSALVSPGANSTSAPASW